MYIQSKSDRRESKAVIRGSSSHRHVKGRIFDHFKPKQCFIDPIVPTVTFSCSKAFESLHQDQWRISMAHF